MTALDDLAATPFHDAADATRARMLSRLADTQLSVALSTEATGDQIELRLFPLEGRQIALACDTEDRLSGFLGAPTPYAAMPGRVLAGLLCDAGAGLLVNPGHPSEMLLDAEMLDWLRSALVAAPQADHARLRLHAPAPATVAELAEPLAERLADLRGLVAGAALAGASAQEGGTGGHVLLISGAPMGEQPAIAKALAEALAFLPPQPGGVDVSFSDQPLPAAVLRFDLSVTAPDADASPRPKGPPILR